MARTGRRAAAPALATVVTLVGMLACGCVDPSGSETPEPTPVVRPEAPAGELPGELQSRLRAALEDTMAVHGVPGATVGVWIPGLGSWTVGLGVADLASGEAVTTELSWPIRSITKSYTVTLLLQLVDEGVVRLEDPVDRYLEGVTHGDAITLLQLADMSSGVADYITESFIEDFAADPARVFTLEELNAGVLGAPARFAPGARHVYTNANTNLLGAVIEAVTGQDFAEVLEARILRPLGQTGTSYLSDVRHWTAAHATGYLPAPETGELLPQVQNFSVFGPAGSLVSTLEDGRVWAQVLGSGALLRPETQELRLRGHELEGPPYGLYAAGIGETAGWLGHNGEGIGFTAATFHEPTTGASIVVYMNLSNVPSGAHPADEAFRALAAILADELG